MQNCVTRDADLKSRIIEEENNLKKLSCELEEQQKLEAEQRVAFESVQFEIGKFELADLDSARSRREQVFKQYYVLDSELRTKENRKKDIFRRLDEIKARIDVAQRKVSAWKKSKEPLKS